MYGFSEKIGKRIAKRAGGEPAGYFREWVRPSSGGGDIRYFVLAEDAMTMPVKAYEGVKNSLGQIEIATPQKIFDLYYINDVLRSPKRAAAGYSGMWNLDQDGDRVYIGNACITGCVTSATISGSPAGGTVGSAYSFTPTTSGISSGTYTASGLPPGLSINASTGAITGTPTTANTYVFKITGFSTDSPSCKVSKLFQVVIGT